MVWLASGPRARARGRAGPRDSKGARRERSRGSPARIAGGGRGKFCRVGPRRQRAGRVGREVWAEAGGGASVRAAGPEHVRGGKLGRGCGPCAGNRRGVRGLELLVC